MLLRQRGYNNNNNSVLGTFPVTTVWFPFQAMPASAGSTVEAAASETTGLLFLAVYARVQLWIHRLMVANRAGAPSRKLNIGF